MRVALVQITASDDPTANAALLAGQVTAAAGQGAELVLTPEVTNCVSASRGHQQAVLQEEGADPVLAAGRAAARKAGVWLNIGSLALKAGGGEGRFVNRSVLIAPDGSIAARYDKIHMFDVDLGDGERYRESAAFRPGTRAVLAHVPGAVLGMTICYDLRFPALYRRLAQAGATVLLVPSAFTRQTGAAHWHPLLRARAIETGSFVLAAAQTGQHSARRGPSRATYGHSLAVDPWGTVLADAGAEPGISLVELDLAAVARARARVPSLAHDRVFWGP